MARIPMYEEPQTRVRSAAVGPQSFQNIQMPNNPIPGALAGVADSIEGAGRNFQQIGQMQARIEQDQQEKAELSKLHEAKNQFLLTSSGLMDGTTDDQGRFTPGLSQTVGAQAQNLLPTYKTAHDKATADIDKGLQEYPRAKELFQTWQQEQFISNSVRLNRHQGAETHKAQIATAETLLKTASDVAVKRFQTEGVLNTDDVERAVVDQAILIGAPVATHGIAVFNAKSSILKNIIDSGLQSDDPQAAMNMVTFYEDNKHKLSTVDNLVVDNKVKTVRENFYGTDAGKVIFSNMMQGVTVNNAPPSDKMVEAIESDTDLTDGEKKIAKAVIADELSQYNKIKTAKQEELSNIAHGVSTYAEGVKKVRDAKGLVDDQARDNIMDALDRKFKISENRNKADSEAKLMRSLQQQSNLFTFRDKYLRGDYGTLTPAQVATQHMGVLGPFTDNAMKFVDDVNKDLGKAKVQDNELTDLVRILGQNKEYAKLLPNMTKPTEQDKAKMALLQSSVQNIIAQSKDAPGKGITIQQAILKAITPIKTDDGYFSNTQEPLYILGSDMSSKYGKNPASWPVDSQNKYISEKFYSNPANKGKRLDFKTLEKYRAELSRGN